MREDAGSQCDNSPAHLVDVGLDLDGTMTDLPTLFRKISTELDVKLNISSSSSQVICRWVSGLLPQLVQHRPQGYNTA
jgi:hypothetical protein